MVGTYIRKLDLVDQDQDHRRRRGSHHEQNRARGNEKQDDGQRTAIDVEVSERVHEILEEERRAGHEHEQRQLPVVKAEGPPE